MDKTMFYKLKKLIGLILLFILTLVIIDIAVYKPVCFDRPDNSNWWFWKYIIIISIRKLTMKLIVHLDEEDCYYVNGISCSICDCNAKY